MNHPVTLLMYLIILISGAIGAYCSMTTQIKMSLDSKLYSKELEIANTGVLVLSTIMLTATLVFIYCSYYCSACDKSKDSGLSSGLQYGYYLLILLVSISFTALGALSLYHAKNNATLLSNGRVVMITGIVGIVLLLVTTTGRKVMTETMKNYEKSRREDNAGIQLGAMGSK